MWVLLLFLLTRLQNAKAHNHITEMSHVTQKVKPYHILHTWELSELYASAIALGVQVKKKLWVFVQWKLLCASPVAVPPWKNNFSCLQAFAVITQPV